MDFFVIIFSMIAQNQLIYTDFLQGKEKKKKETKMYVILEQNVLYCELKKKNCGWLAQIFLFKHKLQPTFGHIYSHSWNW